MLGLQPYTISSSFTTLNARDAENENITKVNSLLKKPLILLNGRGTLITRKREISVSDPKRALKGKTAVVFG
jgi:hypothetical protein